jgi:hypothetical protein
MAFTGSSLYEVADNLGVPHIKDIAKQAGVISVLRVTAYYSERKARHSVATVVQRHQDQREMRIVYEGFFNHKPVTLNVTRDNLENMLNALQRAKFDTLYDQASLSYKDHVLWLVQRAAGIYLHGVIVSPDIPEMPYSTIVNAIDSYLPEAIREVPLT